MPCTVIYTVTLEGEAVEEKCGCVEVGTKGQIPKYCPKHLSANTPRPSNQKIEKLAHDSDVMSQVEDLTDKINELIDRANESL